MSTVDDVIDAVEEAIREVVSLEFDDRRKVKKRIKDIVVEAHRDMDIYIVIKGW